MLASFSEFERATITERGRDGSRRALRRAFKEDKHLVRIPSGYGVDKDGAFVECERNAKA